MKRQEVDLLETLVGQLAGHHSEITALAKKSPNDAVNPFKLKFINATLADCNRLLGETYKPFDDFGTFDVDQVPSNSDVTFILAQYIQAVEKLRCDNIFTDRGRWFYRLSDSKDEIRTAPPAKIEK
jgi:hypothetical protein